MQELLAIYHPAVLLVSVDIPLRQSIFAVTREHIATAVAKAKAKTGPQFGKTGV